MKTLVLLLAASLWAGDSSSHPLDPLSADEIKRATSLIHGSGLFAKDAMIPLLTLREPNKQELKSGKAPREALATVFDRARNETHEAVVDLEGGRLSNWRVMPGVQPALLSDELLGASEIVRKDAAWRDAMRKRGIEDFDRVQIDAWAPGTIGLGDASGPRLARGLSFYRGKSSNYYGRPVEGVTALIDLNERKVVQVIDEGVVPLSPDDGAFDERSLKTRPALKPLRILQPMGVDFEINGREVRWQRWRFRFSMHPREGLVLHTIGYADGANIRPILHRAAFSEMVVPYGDPREGWAWRSAFDVGEYGLGRLASPLERGVDVPDNAWLFDETMADDFGKPFVSEGVIAVYERDGGLLWKHYTVETETNESRRGRELVVAAIATIGNYDYGYQWVFKQDGSLELESLLTGIMLAQGVSTEAAHGGHAENYAHLVTTGIVAPHHQHFFNLRLDFDIDGAANTVCEMDSSAVPQGPKNPHGNAMAMSCAPIVSEKQGRRELNAATGRKWVVQSADRKNALGSPTAYILAPGENAPILLSPKSELRKRAGFLDYPFWVTAYAPEQLYAAGDYPNQSKRAAGLPRWIADDEPLVGRDLVVWYTVGVTHLPRPEEWPVMPVHKVGFKLLPAGFFTRNPALDVPRPRR